MVGRVVVAGGFVVVVPASGVVVVVLGGGLLPPEISPASILRRALWPHPGHTHRGITPKLLISESDQSLPTSRRVAAKPAGITTRTR